MTVFIFAGDMLVMLFMIGLVMWVTTKDGKEVGQDNARIPLEDD
ncbi:hypothetical protein N8303_06310 [Gammaproteobacteria bacterium]|jgi:hypothetical protein|nr:hypothetical protein [Gammaproteobacteria bacterium]